MQCTLDHPVPQLLRVDDDDDIAALQIPGTVVSELHLMDVHAAAEVSTRISGLIVATVTDMSGLALGTVARLAEKTDWL